MVRDNVDMFITLLALSDLATLHKQLLSSPQAEQWMIEEVERQLLQELLTTDV